MKISTNKVITNLKGEALKGEDKKEITFGEVLSNIILSDEKGGKMKTFVLAEKIYKAKESVDLDSADFALLKSSVEQTKTYTNLVTGQVLVYLESLKEEDKEVKEENEGKK